jgi:hypothetical protein
MEKKKKKEFGQRKGWGRGGVAKAFQDEDAGIRRQEQQWLMFSECFLRVRVHVSYFIFLFLMTSMVGGKIVAPKDSTPNLGLCYLTWQKRTSQGRRLWIVPWHPVQSQGPLSGGQGV